MVFFTLKTCGHPCAYVFFPTCISLSVATEGPLRCSMAPVFSSVSMSGRSPLFWYYMLHVVVVHRSFVSVATSGPAMAQRRGRAFHGTAVIDGLRKKERRLRAGEARRDAVESSERGAGVFCYGVRDAMCLCMHACECMGSVSCI